MIELSSPRGVVPGPRQHPLRLGLDREIHARPYQELRAPLRATQLALYTGPGGAAADREHVARLCEDFGARPPAIDAVHYSVDFGLFRLKWERYSEFSAYTFTVPGRFVHGFERPAIERVPLAWLAELPGELIAATHVSVEHADAPAEHPDDLRVQFGTSNLAAARVMSDAATVWSDFRVHPDGYGRILIRDSHTTPRQLGRLIQRLFDIECYRMLAMLSFPLARTTSPEVSRMELRIAQLTERIAAGPTGLENEQAILADLGQLAAESERTVAGTSYRFAASRAYAKLVQRRITELREERLEGVQMIGEFMERRFSPAMNTIEALETRLTSLSERVHRAATLLRTRIDVALEAQNRDLLASMDRRAHLQLRLQETVEGLSVVVLSYYSVGLAGYAFKALAKLGLPLNPDLATGLTIPLAVLGVWLGVGRMRARLTAGEH